MRKLNHLNLTLFKKDNGQNGKKSKTGTSFNKNNKTNFVPGLIDIICPLSIRES